MKLWILSLAGLFLLSSCELARLLTGVSQTTETISKTVKELDQDHDQIISFQEILMYLLAGWATGRGGEAVGTRILKKKLKEKDE